MPLNDEALRAAALAVLNKDRARCGLMPDARGVPDVYLDRARLMISVYLSCLEQPETSDRPQGCWFVRKDGTLVPIPTPLEPGAVFPPGHWRHDTGILSIAITALISGGPLSTGQITAIRAYLRRWLASAPASIRGPVLAELRTSVNEIDSRDRIMRWWEQAKSAGADPL